jgi:hypothetical protein
MQFSAVEKTEIRKSLKRGSSQTEMDRVVSEWNEKHPDRKIDSGHVKRLRDQLPAFDNADAFWQSVEMEVSSKTRQVNAKDEWELKDLPEKGSIPALDAGKIPDISEDELKKFNFDFQNEKYNRQDESGSFAGSDKRLRNDFRDFMEKQGMIYGVDPSSDGGPGPLYAPSARGDAGLNEVDPSGNGRLPHQRGAAASAEAE